MKGLLMRCMEGRHVALYLVGSLQVEPKQAKTKNEFDIHLYYI